MGYYEKLAHEKYGDLTPRDWFIITEYTKDFDVMRLSKILRCPPTEVNDILNESKIRDVIIDITMHRAENTDIDKMWCLYQLVDDYKLAKQNNKDSAKARFMDMILKHSFIDGYGANKIDLRVNNNDLVEQLELGRKNVNRDPDFT